MLVVALDCKNLRLTHNNNGDKHDRSSAKFHVRRDEQKSTEAISQIGVRDQARGRCRANVELLDEESNVRGRTSVCSVTQKGIYSTALTC